MERGAREIQLLGAAGTKLDATNLLLGQLAADIALIKADLAAIRAILES